VLRRRPYLQRVCLLLAIAIATLGCSADPVLNTAATAAEPASTAPSAEPATAQEELVEPTTIMLAIDTSLSMLAEDTAPNRFLGATEAVNAFLDAVPDETHVGLVSFHGIATVELLPTKDRAAVRSAILGLELDEATAVGEAIFASIEALESFAADFEGEPPPARIVLLSDGETTVGRPDAAGIDLAQTAGIAVSTIVFGTDAGTIQAPDTDDPLPIPVPVNKRALAEIADQTGGEFFEAETTAALIAIFTEIGSTL